MRCWYTRWQMSNALDGGDLASRLSRGHAGGCASCQAFGRSLGALHADLARGARTAAPPAPIIGRVRRPLVAGTLALGGAAAVVALGLALGTPDAPIESIATAPPAGEIPDPIARVRSVADRFSQALVKTPLDVELEALIHDGKRGLGAVLATSGLASDSVW